MTYFTYTKKTTKPNFFCFFLLLTFVFFLNVNQAFSHLSYTASPLRPNLQKYLSHSTTKGHEKKQPRKISLHALTHIAEEKYGIPANLLMAIAYVESKCHPYAINARGRGYYFKSKKDAVSFVKELRAQGVRNINVGLMQLNVPSHVNKFRTIDDMLDVSRNIHFAAKLLSRLYQNYGSWSKAVERYKSSFCEESRRYQQYVYSMRGRVKNNHFITLEDRIPQGDKASPLSKQLTHFVLAKKQASFVPKKYHLTTLPWTLCGYQSTSLLEKLTPHALHKDKYDAIKQTLDTTTQKRLSKKINESSLHSLTDYARLPSWGQTFTLSHVKDDLAIGDLEDDILLKLSKGYPSLWDEEIL